MYVDRQAPMGKQAIYQVVLVDARGRAGEKADPVSIARLTPTAAPQGFEANPGDGEVALNWRAVETLVDGGQAKVAGYIVYRQTGDGPEEALFSSPMQDVSLNDKTVENGQSYTYRVAAAQVHRGAVYPGERSMVIEATPRDMVPPQPPEELMGVYQPGGVFLRLAPMAGVAGYVVERRLKDGQWEPLMEEPSRENTFIDETAKKNKVYYYRAVAFDAAGNKSGYSPELEISTKE